MTFPLFLHLLVIEKGHPVFVHGGIRISNLRIGWQRFLVRTVHFSWWVLPYCSSFVALIWEKREKKLARTDWRMETFYCINLMLILII
nr:hypothetical protein Iba_chr01dCG17050 [Ipomoea batatas]